MENFVESTERLRADRNVDSKDCTNKISGENKNSTGNLTKRCSCYILAMHLSTLCPYCKNFMQLSLEMMD